MTTKEKQQLQIHRIKESISSLKWKIILNFFIYFIVSWCVWNIHTAINKLEYGFLPKLKGFSDQIIILFFYSLVLLGQVFVHWGWEFSKNDGVWHYSLLFPISHVALTTKWDYLKITPITGSRKKVFVHNWPTRNSQST